MPILDDPSPCRACGSVLHNSDDMRIAWCPEVEGFAFAHGRGVPEPCHLDAIISAIAAEHVSSIRNNCMFSISFEMFRTKDGLRLAWRALVKVDNKVVEYSRREQYGPRDALRELHLLTSGTPPEDI